MTTLACPNTRPCHCFQELLEVLQYNVERSEHSNTLQIAYWKKQGAVGEVYTHSLQVCLSSDPRVSTCIHGIQLQFLGYSISCRKA